MLEDIMIISVIYEELQKDSYKRVEVCLENITIQFHCGDVVKDFYEAVRFSYLCYQNSNILGEIEHVMMSSSIDHFTQDNDGYGWEEDPKLGALIIKK